MADNKKGDGPIQARRPIVPRAAIRQPNGGGPPKPPVSPVKAPQPPRKQNPPGTDSEDELHEFFSLVEPASEPPMGEPEEGQTRNSDPDRPSWLILGTPEEDETDSEGAAQEKPPGKKLEGFNSLISLLSSTLSRLDTEADGGKISFTDAGVFLQSKKIGEIEKIPGGANMRIWLNELGIARDSFPTSAIFGMFNISQSFLATAIEKANYFSLLAEVRESRSTIKICFHREQTPAVFLSAPIRALPKDK